MTEPQYRRNLLILKPEPASKTTEIVINLGNPGYSVASDPPPRPWDWGAEAYGPTTSRRPRLVEQGKPGEKRNVPS